MKYAEFNIENNKIEFLNSVFGIESVLLNGKTVSKKFSFSGFKHIFKLESSDFTLESKYKQFDKKEIELELFKNGERIKKQVLQTDKKQRFYWTLTAFGFGFLITELLFLLIDNFF